MKTFEFWLNFPNKLKAIIWTNDGLVYCVTQPVELKDTWNDSN